MNITIRPTSELAREPLSNPHYVPDRPAGFLQAKPERRSAVTFLSDGIQLAGHLYRPPQAAPHERTPGIAMCGPISNVKEMTLPHYAERLAAAGYTVLTFDPRGFGESEAGAGRPRWHYDPNEVIQDFGQAVNYLMTRSDVDAGRVAVVGVCMGGGYAVSVGARDKRLKAVVSVAGGSDTGDYFQQWLGVKAYAEYLRKVNDLVQKQYETGEIQYVPSIANELSAEIPVAIMPFAGAYQYYDRTSKAEAPTWSRKMTAASIPAWFAYSAVRHAALVAPTPLLLIHGTRDIELPPEYMQQVYQAAVGPKQFTWVESHNHFEFYNQDPYVSESCVTIIEWLGKQIGNAC